MDFGIKGKIALVTGGTRGIGRAICEELAQEGCTVIVSARTQSAVDEAVAQIRAAGGKAEGVTTDVGSEAAIKASLEDIEARIGLPDIFVYSNGGTRDLKLDDASDEDFLHAHNNLVMGFIWYMRVLLPAMKERGWGRVITIGSMCVKEPHREYPLILHNMGRAAAVGVSKTLASEYGPYGITFNTLATGTIDTGLFRRTWEEAAPKMNRDLDEIVETKRKLIPVGRLGTPQDMAAMCSFLCSDRAGFITGQTIAVDGGRVASLL